MKLFRKCKFLTDSKSGAKILLIAADLIFIGLLLAMVLVPKGATWYTNVRHKSAALPNVLISTFYPCVPFFAVTILTLRKIAKNILNDEAFSEKMQKNIRKLGMLILFVAALMFVAAFFYYPLFVVSLGAAFCAMLIKIFYDVLSLKIEKPAETVTDVTETQEVEPDESAE